MWTEIQREIIKAVNYHVKNDATPDDAIGNVLGALKFKFEGGAIKEKQARQSLRAYNFAQKKFNGVPVEWNDFVSGNF